MSEFSFPLIYRQDTPVAADYISKNTVVLSAKNLYKGALNAQLYPIFNTSNLTDMTSMFYGCNSMLDAPPLDTSKVTTMASMFSGCNLLKTVPCYDTSKVTTMGSMFYGCSQLRKVPRFDTSNVTNMYQMFYNCTLLYEIPHFDTSKVTSMYGAFYSCKIYELPAFNTSNVLTMQNMLQSCSNLRTIPLLDCGAIQSGTSIDMFGSSTMTNLTDLGGFKDLGKNSGFTKPSIFLKNCKNLTKESVMNVINNLYDRKTAGYSVVTLPFNSVLLALLTDEEKAIATNKGWTLATS